MCLMKHPSWNCLVGFGLSRKPELEAQLDREEELAVRLGKEFDRDTRSSQLFGFIEMMIFIGILVVGYIYVWKRGALNWA